MALELLPAELQIDIFSYLKARDLKATRAVCRKFRDNASPTLFRSVVACARYRALGAFQNVSSHSVLQKYIKEIVFDGSVYDHDLANNLPAYEYKNNTIEELRTTSFFRKRARWKRYQELYNDQEDMKASGVILHTIARALEWTTNVSSIVYSPYPHLIPFEAKEIRDLLPRGLNHASSHRARFPGPRISHSDHAFRQLIGAIYLSQYTGIRELRIEPLKDGEPGTEFSLALFDFSDANDMQAGRHLFQNLEKCELNMPLQSPGDVIVQRLANLSNLLATAGDLRHLALHLTHWQPTAASMFQRILQKTWPKLRSLSLEGIYAHKDEFIKLIRQHRYTLISLSFGKCSLLSGAWADIVDEVLYSTRIFPFALKLVNEAHPPTDYGMMHSTERLEEWRYEGYLEVSKDGERNFVEINSTKKSVYHLRQT